MSNDVARARNLHRIDCHQSFSNGFFFSRHNENDDELMSNAIRRRRGGGEEEEGAKEWTNKGWNDAWERKREREKKGEKVVDGKVKKMNSKSQTWVNIRFHLVVFVINQQMNRAMAWQFLSEIDQNRVRHATRCSYVSLMSEEARNGSIEM